MYAYNWNKIIFSLGAKQYSKKPQNNFISTPRLKYIFAAYHKLIRCFYIVKLIKSINIPIVINK